MARCTRWFQLALGIVSWLLVATVVYAAGTIIKQRPPSALRQCSGDTLVLAVQAEPPVGESGLQYQWYKDGAPLRDGGRISGAQTNTLTIANVVSTDAGVYTVVVTTIPSGATEEAQVQVDIAQPVQVTQQPTGGTFCAGQQVTLSVEATGSIDGYQWYHDGSIVPGATEASYTMTATPAGSGEWWCVIISPCGNVISEKVRVQVNVAPQLVTQPTDLAVCRGTSFTLQVEATGTEPLQYQWYQNGTPIAGANQATYQAVATQTATYTVEVSNSCGTVRSQAVTVRVKEPPQVTQDPQGGRFPVGSRVELSVVATGEPPLSYQWYRNNVPIAGATSPTYVILNFSQSDAGDYFCVVTNECGADTSGVVRVEPTGITEYVVGHGVILRVIAPHPVTGVATIRFQLVEEGWVRLRVADLYGRPIAVLQEGFLPAGEHVQRLDAAALGLAAGAYVYELQTATGTVRQLMVVAR